MTDTVFSMAFDALLKKLISNFEEMMPTRPDKLMNEMTLTQFSSLANIDTDQSIDVANDIEGLLKEYKNCLELESQLITKKRELFSRAKIINNKIDKNISTNEEQRKLLEKKCYTFLQVPEQQKQKISQVFAYQQKLPEPPVYSSRPVRQQQSVNSSRKNPVPPVPSTCHEFSLDKSILEESKANDTVQFEKVERRLEFDDENDEDENEVETFRKPVSTSSSVLQSSIQSKKNILSNSSLFDIPSPPVYTSSTGKLLNKK